MSGFVEDSVEVFENLFDGHGVHFASVVVTGFDGLLEIAAGGLCGEHVSDDIAGTLFLLDPGEAGHGDPDGAAVYIEADIHRIGVARGDSDDVGCPAAVESLPCPAVSYAKVLIHSCF